MSSGLRDQPRWAQNSLKEAEVAHFRKLQSVQALVDRLRAQVSKHLDEREAALAAGVDPVIVLLGPRACGLDAQGNPLPEKPEAPADKPKAPAKPKLYKPRIYAPPLMALAVRVCEMALDLAPLIRAQWTVLVCELRVDPRRLALDADSEAVAALMLDELGIQYHEIGATEDERLRDALNKIEAWIKEAKVRKPFEEKEGPAQSGPPAPPAPSTVEGPEPPVAEKASGTFSPDDGEKEPDPTQPGTYSASGDSLNWTKL